MSRLFHREVELTLARPLDLFTPSPNATIIRDLRIAFKVEKKLGKEPNNCDIVVMNLGPDTRRLLDQKPVYVRLDAGYDGDLERLFTGDLLFSRTRPAGSSNETVIQVKDGARAYEHARVNRSFKAGVTLRDCLKDVSDSLGLRLPTLTGTEFDKQFATGVVLFGSAQREMTRLLAPFQMVWSIQDGRLQILKKEEARKDLAVLISEDTGMLDSPEYGPSKEKGKPPVINVRSRLRPGLTPGSLIKVVSKVVTGAFKLQSVSHEGDTHSGPWDTMMEGLQI